MVDKKKISVLIVDDEVSLLGFVTSVVSEQAEVTSFNDGREALHSVERDSYDIAFLDLMMPQVSGLELLAKIKEVHPETVVIIMTGYGTVESSVSAMKLGAYDFIQKPFNVSQLKLSLERAINFVRVKHENVRLRQLKPNSPFVDIIGNSTRIKEVFEIIKKVAKTDINVLIMGASGTGKELIAQAIHNSSPKNKEALIPVNCSAIPESLMESSLFGHRKGAFTGAYRDYPGLLHYANGGTLFLDEIGDMPLSIQAKLLRVLQTHRYRPLGGSAEMEVNMRVIAATNRNLEDDVAKNLFREDLYYRLNVVNINVPTLSERESDIPQLARYFLKLFCDPLQEPQIVDFSRDALQRLKSYSWPGNVRELQNVVERAVSLTDHQYIQVDDLPPRIINETRGQAYSSSLSYSDAKAQVVNEFENRYLRSLLERTQGNLNKILEESGVSRRQLFRLMKKNSFRLRDFQ